MTKIIVKLTWTFAFLVVRFVFGFSWLVLHFQGPAFFKFLTVPIFIRKIPNVYRFVEEILKKFAKYDKTDLIIKQIFKGGFWMKKNNKNSLLNNPGKEDLEIYSLYVERIKKHYDLRLVHFKIYLGFNTGLILIVGYLLKLSLENNKISSTFPFIIYIPLLGMFFSLAWLLVAINDRKVQLDMNETLAAIEKEILKNEKLGLYYRINKEYSPNEKMGIDIIDINVYIAFFFYVVWFLARFYLFLFPDMILVLV